MYLSQPHAMKKEAHLIVLNINSSNFLVFIIIAKHKHIEVESWE
jgi:hypothetical protein